jgi:hypothetical protein
VKFESQDGRVARRSFTTALSQVGSGAGARTVGSGGNSIAFARDRRSPNLNAYAERWVRSVKEECLAKKVEAWTTPVNQRTIKAKRDFLPLIQTP